MKYTLACGCVANFVNLPENRVEALQRHRCERCKANTTKDARNAMTIDRGFPAIRQDNAEYWQVENAYIIRAALAQHLDETKADWRNATMLDIKGELLSEAALAWDTIGQLEGFLQDWNNAHKYLKLYDTIKAEIVPYLKTSDPLLRRLLPYAAPYEPLMPEEFKQYLTQQPAVRETAMAQNTRHWPTTAADEDWARTLDRYGLGR